MPGVTEEQITAAKQMSAIEFLRRYRPGQLVKAESRGAVSYTHLDVYKRQGYSLSSSLPAPFGGYSTDKFTELRINDLTAFRTAYCLSLIHI